MDEAWNHPAPVLMIADGNSHLIEFAVELMQAGYAISTAQDAAQALEQIAAQPWDAVLIELTPVSDSLAVGRHILQHAPDLPVILLLPRTADTTSIDDAFQAGIYDVVVTPPIKALLRAALVRAIMYHRLRRGMLPGTGNRLDHKVVHDISNYLSGILGVAQLYREDTALPDDLREDFEQIIDNAYAIHDLLRGR